LWWVSKRDLTIIQIDDLAKRAAQPFSAAVLIDKAAGDSDTDLVRVAQAVSAAEAVFPEKLRETEIEGAGVE
jgi:hypothetical protein